MSGCCPFCGSTDVADLVDGRRSCLDCEGCWSPKESKGDNKGVIG